MRKKIGRISNNPIVSVRKSRFLLLHRFLPRPPALTSALARQITEHRLGYVLDQVSAAVYHPECGKIDETHVPSDQLAAGWLTAFSCVCALRVFVVCHRLSTQ